MMQRWMSHGIAFALGAAVTALVFVVRAPGAAPQAPGSPPAALVRAAPGDPMPRIPADSGARAPGDDQTAAAVLAVLEAKRVKGLQWEDLNLDQVVAYLRTVTGLNFFITPRVRSQKFDEVKVTLGPLDDVSVWQILDRVTAPYDLTWEAKGGVVHISMK